MPVDKVLAKIERLEINGSENIAKASFDAIKELVHKSHATTPKALLKELQEARLQFERTLLEEPCLRNGMKYIFYDLGATDLVTLTKELCERIDAVLSFFDQVESKVAAQTLPLLKSGGSIFTYSYSSTVLHALQKAKKEHANFSVLLTEARPHYFGRRMALDLQKLKIPVSIAIDAAAKAHMKQADILLLGCDSVTHEEVYVAMGGELLALLAKKYEIPVYICTNSWKFDPYHLGKDGKLTQRPAKEVWEDAPIGVKIYNYMYEKLDPHLVDGIVSELGVLSHADFVRAIKEKYPWVSKH